APAGSGGPLAAARPRRTRDQIGERSPGELGIAAAVWSRTAVRDQIRQEFGIDMPVRTVGAYLKRWGYTAKSPRRHAQDQDPDEVDRWLEGTYPAIEARAATEDAEIHWCDETGAAADEPPRKGYAREGDPAWGEVPKPHIRINLVATITAEGEVHFLPDKESMTGALFVTFLAKLLSETTRKVFLILDRLPAHETKAVADWVAGHGDRIELFWLPKSA